MSSIDIRLTVCSCALALVATLTTHAGTAAASDPASTQGKLVFLQSSSDADLDIDLGAEQASHDDSPLPGDNEELPPDTLSQLPPDTLSQLPPDEEESFATEDYAYEYSGTDFHWQVGPSGIIYRSYLAGPHQPRISITPFFASNHSYWDATVGGRGGVLRYGNDDPLHPQGWQLDVYGAAIVRMDAENHQDLNGSDYVFGFPITYGVGNWQYKFGYAHISSHMGDEYAIRYPGALDERINYVRDGLVFGTSWYPVPICRVYGEFDWAFHNSGGSKPIAFQFGNELSKAGPTGTHGSPFAAFNGRMREDVDYGGDLTVQSGWLWRGDTGKVFRIGAHYYNGKSSQSQWFNTWEEQIGMGLWYDF